MSLIIHSPSLPPVDISFISQLKDIPTTVISDELNRFGTMDSDIRPLREGYRIFGPALTVQTMAADNLAIHHAINCASVGDILVVDAGSYKRSAVWGGILHRAAQIKGIAGIVIDGCVRDVNELRTSNLPCYSRGIVPAGPHKGWGGEINGVIHAGGCVIFPGDFIVADDDGVVVVPRKRISDLIISCISRISMEAKIVERINAGETTIEIMGLSK